MSSNPYTSRVAMYERELLRAQQNYAKSPTTPYRQMLEAAQMKLLKARQQEREWDRTH